MSITASQLVAEIKVTGADEATIQIKNVGQSVDEAQEKAKGAQGAFGDFLKSQIIFSALSTAAGFLRDQITSVFQDAMNMQAVMSQTNAVLQSTHDASGMTAQAVADLADKYSRLTLFSEDTTESAENMLLTFTNIGKNVFPLATKTVLDMSQALGQDTKSSAIQLGKALNDPITGISALQRVGVTFTDSQKNLIKSLVDSGNVAGAQKVILQELQREFGGSAEAAGKTFPGQLQILGQSMDDIKQKIGDALLPVLQGLTSWVSTNVVPAFDHFSDWMQKTGAPALQNFANFVQHNFQPILAGLAGFITAVVVPAFWAWAAAMIANPVGLIITGIALAVGGLVATFTALYNNNPQFKSFIDNLVNGMKQAAGFIQTNFLPAMKQIGDWIQTYVWPILQSVGSFIAQQFVPVWKQLTDLWNSQLLPLFKQIQPALQQMMPLFQLLGIIIGGIVAMSLGVLIGLISGVAKGLSYFVEGLANVITGVVRTFTGVTQFLGGIVQFIVDLFTGHFDKLGADLGQIWQGIVNMFQGVLQAIGGVFQAAWGLISGIVVGFVQGVIGFFQHLADEIVGHSIIPDMVNSIVNWIAQLPGRVGTWVANMATTMINKLADLAKQAVQAGSNIVSQIAQGIISGIAQFLGNAMNQVGNFIQSHLPHSPAKQGPLKTLAEAGSNIPAEIARGMVAGIPAIQAQLNMMLTPVAQAPLALGASAPIIATQSVGTQVASNQPIILVMDGRAVARGTLPHIVSELRNRLAVSF